ncbi:MAG: tRNA (cytidine(34)-2'-O)-methyltransferase [Stappiaceae bacterium]
MPDIALYQPDIPQNTGTILRLGACMGVHVHIIEPCGFALSDHSLKRAGMDYVERSALEKHLNWDAFELWRETAKRRLIVLSTKAEVTYTDFSFDPNDLLLFGRESSGVPQYVHDRADVRLTIPMAPGLRSLNIAVSAGMALGEALRQTHTFP